MSAEGREKIAQPDGPYLDRVTTTLHRVARVYHRIELDGLEQLPREGPALLLSTHGLASYDLILTIAEVYQQTGRLVRGLGDDFFWRWPPSGAWLDRLGVVRATETSAQALLRAGELVGLCPGGMWEALKPSNERFQLRWGQRRGFARLALQTGVPVILATCPGADRISTVYPSRLTDAVYRRWHLPLPICRGLGLTLIPRPVKLRVYFRAPIIPPPIQGEVPTEQEVEAFRALAYQEMEAWIRRCLGREGYDASSS